MKNIINMNSQRKQVITLDDTVKVNELNDFFYRFETLDFFKEGAEALKTVHTSSWCPIFQKSLDICTLEKVNNPSCT